MRARSFCQFRFGMPCFFHGHVGDRSSSSRRIWSVFVGGEAQRLGQVGIVVTDDRVEQREAVFLQQPGQRGAHARAGLELRVAPPLRAGEFHVGAAQHAVGGGEREFIGLRLVGDGPGGGEREVGAEHADDAGEEAVERADLQLRQRLAERGEQRGEFAGAEVGAADFLQQGAARSGSRTTASARRRKTRSRISEAAARVKVVASTCSGRGGRPSAAGKQQRAQIFDGEPVGFSAAGGGVDDEGRHRLFRVPRGGLQVPPPRRRCRPDRRGRAAPDRRRPSVGPDFPRTRRAGCRRRLPPARVQPSSMRSGGKGGEMPRPFSRPRAAGNRPARNCRA